ncbi:unnamed protein product (macronuclear) [Paramecium tetraurelia]|uniref:FAD/NAD(P)-binding domain-containing protein n=1 Tax=Paramecium tetraurelia TaxID=5888 RepID=A0BR74_PARTE|nr:uncharacterized protein GSPATT00031271001 [Paramecium tetraurelia]CAK61041.1 unnamed protein product [Paramecium tetraurelia]|eukprot:XP_001428439.1 hypothetical protein (macronuclear) [Paramecium tetraurelia strain d4-2]
MLISGMQLRHSLTPRFFAGVFNKRKPTKKDLDHYDIVVIGCNLGGVLSRQLDKVSHGKYKIMVVLDQNINQITPIRQIYEQQKTAKTDFLLNAKLSLNMYTAHSDQVGCSTILPEENAIVLRNGRRIGYNQLVVAMGQQVNYDAIKGFEEAWQDFDSPVFTNLDHPSWRSSNHKYTRWHYNFNHGEAYFCIPQFPFSGEVESYNFLLSQRIWEWQTANGRQSPIKKFTIIQPNERFVQYNDAGDSFFKEELKRRNINVEYGLKLVEVNKQYNTATFEDVKTGNRQTRNFNHLYAVAPTKAHEPLVKAGLTTSKGLLDVNIKTLQHNKQKNIFGLGDVNDLPTTNCFWAGFHQLHVVRNNIERNIAGKSLNAEYDGYSKVPIILGQNTLTFLCHKYNNENAWHNLYFSNGGFLAALRYYNWCKNFKKAFIDIYLEKNWGPPYYKLKKSFKLPEGEKDDHGFLSKLLPGKKDSHH